MSETGVGLSDLPDGWVWTALEEVIQIIDYRGRTPPYSSEGIPHLRSSNIKNGKIIWNDLKYVTEETYDKYMTRGLPRQGDLLFTTEAPLGEVAFAPNKKFSLAQRIMILRPFEDIIKPEFLLYQIQAGSFQERLRISETGSVVKGISSRNFKPFPIIIPPLPEQHRIVAKIEELFTKLDAGINELHKAQSQLKRYRQSVLKAAFEGKLTEAWRAEHQDKIEPASVLLERILKERREKWEAEQLEQMKAKGKRPKDDRWKAKYKEPVATDTSELPELPNGWRWTTVGDIGLVASGQTPKGINDLNLDGEIPFYKISDMNKLGSEKFMQAAEITLDDNQTAKLGIHVRKQGTVIFPKRGGAIATNKKRILSCPSAYDLNIMGVLPYIVPTDFFYQWLLSIDLAALSDGSNVPQINHKDIDPLPFPLPPLSEQQAIVSEVESRLSVADEVEKTITAELKRAEQLRQSILKRAFSGKLVPQDPNDEPASVLLERIKAEKSQRS